MPDFGDFLDWIERVLNLIFVGSQIPLWIPKAIGWIFLIAFILLGILGLLIVISKIIDVWKEKIWPHFYNPEEKRRNLRRRRFAEHIESEIRRLNRLEEWSDYRFTELEAEVEAEGRRRMFNYIPFIRRTYTGLRKEKSLSKALEKSDERLILVEGEPGSGKSVGLRYVTVRIAQKAMKSNNNDTVIPIFVNLKELKRERREPIDRKLIYNFVLKSLNRVNDRDIEEFLDNEFDKGLQENSWLFLFDSFDEIPEILSSTEADSIIRSYAEAISDFLHGMNRCRGVIASRQFRGPGGMGWPRFIILPLSEVRQLELIRKAEIKPDTEEKFIGQLGIAQYEIRSMASNPLFLGLISEHVKAGNPFPTNVHSVFETYIQYRFKRDEERLQKRFHLTHDAVRTTAENVAFCMAADPGLGLTPTRENIRESINKLEFELPKNFDNHLDALEFIKLARSESSVLIGESRPFTFAHRRFQEYFATNVVLKESTRVTPFELLTNGKWRETVVTLFQTQSPTMLDPILAEVQKLLEGMTNLITNLISEPIEYINEFQSEKIIQEANLVFKETNVTLNIKDLPTTNNFPWPSGSLHLLSLLQDGFANNPQDIPKQTKKLTSQIILTVWHFGSLIDRKWGLEVAGIVDQEVLTWLIRQAFSKRSQWLRDIAYKQAGQINNIPKDILEDIRNTLIQMTLEGSLRKNRYSISAHLSRLSVSKELLQVNALLSWTPIIDYCIHIIFCFLVLLFIYDPLPITIPNYPPNNFLKALIIMIPPFMLWPFLSLLPYELKNNLIHKRKPDFENLFSLRFLPFILLLSIVSFPIILDKSLWVYLLAVAKQFSNVQVQITSPQNLPDGYNLFYLLSITFQDLLSFLLLSTKFILPLLIFMYGSVWVFAILDYSYKGEYIALPWWISYPILPYIIDYIKNINIDITKFIKNFFKYLFFIFSWGTISIFVTVTIYLSSVTSYLMTFFIKFYVIFLSIFLFISIIRIFTSLFQYILDSWNLRTISKIQTLSSVEFIDYLSVLNKNINRVRLINIIRIRNIIPPESSNLYTLENIALRLEFDREKWLFYLEVKNSIRRKIKLLDSPKKTIANVRLYFRFIKQKSFDFGEENIKNVEIIEEVRDWYANYTKKDCFKFARWGNETLDEFYKLIEQFRKK